MASEWKFTRLSELVTIKHGYAFSGQFFTEDSTETVLLTPGNFRIGGGFKEDKPKGYSGPILEEYVLRPGDLLVTMTDLSRATDTLGFPAMVPSHSKRKFLHNQRLGKVETCKGAELDRLFLYYLLCSKPYRDEVVGSATGSTVKHTSPSRIMAFGFQKPSLAEQERIGQTLYALDQRIKTAEDMNIALEAIARTIFKSWFVDFDPVRAKAEGREPEGMDADTAALFPSEFQESELGRIPRGWSTTTIKELASNIQYGFTTSANSQDVGPKFLRITDIQGGRVSWNTVPYCSASESEHDRYRLKPHDIVVARTGASTGENIYLPAVPEAVFASYLVRFQFAQPNIARLVGEFMRTPTYFDFVQNSIGGSAQPNASAQVLAGAKLVLPEQALSMKYAEIVTSLDQKRCHSADQITTLADLRDALLPRLISGKLRVQEAEKLVEAVV